MRPSDLDLAIVQRIIRKLHEEISAFRGGSESATEAAWRFLETPEGEDSFKRVAQVIAMGGMACYPIEIKPASYAELVALGKYDEVEIAIQPTAPFPEASSFGRFNCWLFRYAEEIGTQKLIGLMMNERLMPASFVHLLGFGAQYPDVQRLFPVVALGELYTPMISRQFAQSLSCFRGLRRLEFRYANQKWDDAYRFLAITPG